ncbi:MAG: radical SAM protein [Gemmatimonadetes bacterium]|nr:radical SAM protein [Gemmatimonadota bacterium]
MAPALPVLPAPLRLLTSQADLRYHAAPGGGIFNPPSATHMGFWSINPYVGCAFGCAYCYARDTHRYTIERAGAAGQAVTDSLPPWLAFERRVLVKEHAGARVREALRTTRAPRAGDSLVIGSATDPYQPAERRFRVTRSVLEALEPVRGLSLTIITKSPLVTRDIPLLQGLARHNTVAVHVSLITTDRDLARRLEPRAPTPDSRLRAVARLAAAGVEVSVNCMPVLPGITDAPQQLADVIARVAAAGARSFGACALRLRAASRRRWMPVVREHFPALAPRYASTYRDSVYAAPRYREGLQQVVQRLCAQHGLQVREYRRLDPAGRVALEAEERSAQERSAQERSAQERSAQERSAQERSAQERSAQERSAQERAAHDVDTAPASHTQLAFLDDATGNIP